MGSTTPDTPGELDAAADAGTVTAGTASDADADRSETDPVTLTYTLTARELDTGMRARGRLLRSVRVARVCWIVATVCVVPWVCFEAILLVTGHAGDVDAPILMGFVAVLVAFPVGFPWLRRRNYRRVADAIGQMHVTLDGTGLHGIGKDRSGNSSWAAYGRYIETEDLFVLLSPDSKSCIVTVLPKRGIEAPAEADQLRALLDQHIERVGRR